MARNVIQMQKGLSLSEFQARYGSEEKCRDAVRAWRWPGGFVCPHCGCRDHAFVGRRQLYLCHGCRAQTSLKAGAIFARTLLLLTKWFQGMYLLTQSKNSISGFELARQLGVRPDTAALMRHELMSVMSGREASRKLDGRAEMDDVVLGGENDGGKRGRGGPNKTPSVVGVETSKEGHLLRLLLTVMKSHNGNAIEAMARAHLEPGCRVISDGLGCFRAVTKAGCVHEQTNATKANDHGEKLACFRWVNTVIGNLKTAIAGTLKSVAPRYVSRYLAEFQYRFNRRFHLPEMLARLACVATRSAPRTYKALKIAYKAG
jgi:transposase-like protein